MDAETTAPVQAKAALIDPETMTVSWMNEAALQDLVDGSAGFAPGDPLEKAVPLADMLGLASLASAVAETGESRHARTSLVSTAKGSMLVTASLYRLPGGQVLLLVDRTWESGRTPGPGGTGSRRARPVR